MAVRLEDINKIPRVTNADVIPTLSKFAQMDAHHDFDGVDIKINHTTTERRSIYDEATKTKGLTPKDVLGIPIYVPPSKTDETAALDELFTIHKEGTKITSKSFFETFVQNRNNIEDQVTFTVAEHTYKVKAIKVFNKIGTNKKIKTTNLQTLFNWLNVNGGAGSQEIAFGIDAQKVPFYEYFIDKTEQNIPNGTAHFLKTREEFIDAASKVTLEDTTIGNFKLFINTNDNTNTNPIVYPSANVLGEYEPQFYSNYTINLFPIQKVETIPSCNMEIVDEQIRYPVNVVKGNIDDSHVNSVPSLVQKMLNILTTLTNIFRRNPTTKAIPDKTALQSYFTRKRAGDWLQVLSCLQPERYGLAPHIRPFLVTLDRICLAYGILMGVDMIYTTQNDDAEGTGYWLLFFHKEVQTDPTEVLAAQVKTTETYISNVLGQITKPSNEQPMDYNTFVANYTRVYNDHLNDLRKQITSSIASIIPGSTKRFNGDDFENKIKSILYVYAKLAVFRATIPNIPVPNTDAGLKGTDEQKREAILRINQTLNSIQPILTKLEKTSTANVSTAYQTNFGNGLKTFFNKKFTATINVKSKTQVLSRDIFDVINKDLRIFEKNFGFGSGSATSKTNGPALFTYFNSVLSDTEKNDLIDNLTAAKSSIPLGDKQKQDQYGLFLSFAQLLTQTQVPNQPPVTIDSFHSISNVDLIQTTGIQVPPSNTDMVNDDSEPTAQQWKEAMEQEEKNRVEALEETKEEEEQGEAEEEDESMNQSIQEETMNEPMNQSTTSVVGSKRGRNRIEPSPTNTTTNTNENRIVMQDVKRIYSKDIQYFNSKDVEDLATSEGKPLDADYMTDCYAASLLLSMRANQEIGPLAAGGFGPQEGGGSTSYTHSPLTTFYMFFRDLSFRMTWNDMPDGYMKYIIQVSKLLTYLLSTVDKKNKEFYEPHLKLLEVIVLQYLPKSNLLQEYSSELSQILLHFKYSYYGFHHVSKQYEKQLLKMFPTASYIDIMNMFTSGYSMPELVGDIESLLSNQISENEQTMHAILTFLRRIEHAPEQTMRTGIAPGELAQSYSRNEYIRPMGYAYGGKRSSTLKRHVGKQTRGHRHKQRSSRKRRGYKNKMTRKHPRDKK